MPRPSPRHLKVCDHCGTSFKVIESRRDSARFCSRPCLLGFRSNIMRHVDQSGGPEACWPWTSSDDGRAKYGRASVNGKAKGAHVAVYERLVGEIPTGLEIDHLCRNTICCNPAHMEPVTRRENVLRQPKVISARTADRCCNGHLWTPENTYIHPTQGSRICRICTYAAVARYKERKSRASHHRKAA